VFLFGIVTMSGVALVSAQDEILVTVTTPSYMGNVFDADTFAVFQADHPGVKVVVIPSGQDAFFPPAAYGLDDHLKGAEKYAASADVLYVSNNNLSVESTRAGYFLDLTPLVTSDAALDTSDFFPSAWQSFQWDQGIWAIPAAASLEVLVYNKDAFDKAGLAYPNEKWTLDDLANAARALTLKDDQGSGTLPGIDAYNIGLLFASLLGEGFYDNSVVPNPPHFTNPQLPALLDGWSQLQKDIQPSGSFQFDQVPMTVGQPWQLTNGGPASGGKWAASLLPGGKAGLDVQGFAVSRGTQSPELAYALAEYLTTNARVVNGLFANFPARRSLVGVTVEDSPFVAPKVPDDIQAFLDKALDNAIPSSELRYADYLNVALNKITQDKVDAQTALQDAEATATENLNTASKKHDSLMMVATPAPTPSFGANQIVMKFGVNLFISPLPNRSQWDALIKDFLAQNPAVGNIDLIEQVYQQNDMAKLDCYFQPHNEVPNAKLEDYLNLDPFMDADADFDRDDFLKGVLPQMQRNDHIWGYPITVQPSILWYDSVIFSKAGLPAPDNGWTVDEFNDALKRLKDAGDSRKPPFVPQTFGNTYLLMLMAAYGALPYDFRTSPPTINFSDPRVLAGVRQVLDLAKNGYIEYKELASNTGGTFAAGDQPIFSDTLSNSSWRLQSRQPSGSEDPYRLTNYPVGSHLTPVAYSIGAAYVRATAQNPDACYRWIKMLAQHPDLFEGMPARRSQIDDPSLAMAQGSDIVSLYKTFAKQVEQPNAIVFPGEFGGSGSMNDYIEQIWMNRAFDNYVLRNGDLEADMAQAAQWVAEDRGCVATIPPYDPAVQDTTEKAIAYYRQFTDCAIKVDPTLKNMFSYLYQ
jgi:ABC-type glycerol-3-phosphate transport system substrate-binding protein